MLVIPFFSLYLKGFVSVFQFFPHLFPLLYIVYKHNIWFCLENTVILGQKYIYLLICAYLL